MLCYVKCCWMNSLFYFFLFLHNILLTHSSNLFSSPSSSLSLTYSVGARPSNINDYQYDKIADDVLALADSYDIDKFNLVGHDHGACLSWYIAAKDAKLPTGQQRLKSLIALSVPHLDAFSDGLIGDNADLEQQIASQCKFIDWNKITCFNFCFVEE